ncbi:hypothetical protein EOA32_20950 [Mesorhizobium sp. M1A.F.Ca.ET.072.01.1.1]|uniref:hypothetical protein n=1 Tax=Mesorhizobium sp. M1A.F.Ca.ET.072.01.1.1 TaxID=2496753 RepID=UPI000FD3CF0E|nr:hypothetical protein [Mesorhizobium sp. M1A.F.Ca.ET.072.01.1.1]RUW49922.1 hypothetical protein EOA32_20950 [Mesorhizobium sp. M1A.F.Ca.ET.072.01.1.1]TIU96595.1 MAG: hypothetical protein E5W04_28135 [Mesorhizobium sp.]
MSYASPVSRAEMSRAALIAASPFAAATASSTRETGGGDRQRADRLAVSSEDRRAYAVHAILVGARLTMNRATQR